MAAEHGGYLPIEWGNYGSHDGEEFLVSIWVVLLIVLLIVLLLGGFGYSRR
jgi:hypothetical protein